MFLFFLFFSTFSFARNGSALCEQGARFDALRVDYLVLPLQDKSVVSIYHKNQKLGEVLYEDDEIEDLPYEDNKQINIASWFAIRKKKVVIKVSKMVKKARKHTKQSDVLLFIDYTQPSIGGCSIGTDANDIWVSKAEFLSLKKEVAELKKRISPSRKSSRRTMSSTESKAKKILDKIHQLVAKGEIDKARSALVDLQREYSNTRMWKWGKRLKSELSVFGKGAPVYMGIVDFLQEKKKLTFSKGVTLLVFTESWCPYCIREMPKLEVFYRKYTNRGLQVIGVTKLSRSSTKKKMQAILKKKNISYTVIQEDGALSQYFKVTGIPAAAVIKDGVIVWRGHPGRLTAKQLESWL